MAALQNIAMNTNVRVVTVGSSPMTMAQHAAKPFCIDDTPSEPDAEQ
jgi:hypothetical protein